MCGRFYVDDEMLDEIRKICNDLDVKYHNAPRGEVYPSEKALIIEKGGSSLQAVDRTWGYSQKSGKQLLINARSETIQEKVTFRDDYQSHRLVVPVRAFYEWSSKKQKFLFHKEEVIFLAGIYTLQDGGRFTILTKQADETVGKIHDRMPVVVHKNSISDWIYGEKGISQVITEMDNLQLVCQSADGNKVDNYEQLELPL